MRKNIIVKSITTAALIVNVISAVFYVLKMENIIFQKLNVLFWVVSELWMILFVYANCVYVPRDERNHRKNHALNKRMRLLSDIVLFVAGLYIIFISMARFCIGDYGILAFMDIVGISIGVMIIVDIINRRAEKEFNLLIDLLFGKHNL